MNPHLDIIKAAIGGSIAFFGFVYNKIADSFPLATAGGGRVLEVGSQLTFSAAAVYACIHLFRALMDEKNESRKAAVRFAEERLAVAERHALERRQESERHAQALAHLHAVTREESLANSLSSEESRQEMILEFRGLKSAILQTVEKKPTTPKNNEDT